MGENPSKRRPGSRTQSDARRAARRAAREAVMALLFESEYHEDESPETIYLRAAEARELDTSDRYIRKAFTGIMENRAVIDALIGRHATGWRTGRLSRVSRAVLRLGTYELVFDESIPAPIAINEAVELAKKYDEPRARAFINGVLNAIKNELVESGGRLPEEILAASETATESVAESVDAIESVVDIEPAITAEILETPDESV